MDTSGGAPLGSAPLTPRVPKRPETKAGSTQGLGSPYYNYYFFNY